MSGDADAGAGDGRGRGDRAARPANVRADAAALRTTAHERGQADTSGPFIDAVRLAEALVFASAEPVDEQAVAELLRARLPEPGPDARAVLLAVQARFAGGGVVLAEVAGGWQFRTAPDLAPALTTVLERPRRLPRVAMETLAIVAYHQPCTRTEIESIRGVSLGQHTLDQLLENGLIAPKGRREVPGRPVLWGTSASFLQRFGLRDLGDLPRREELLVELPGAAAGPDAADGTQDG